MGQGGKERVESRQELVESRVWMDSLEELEHGKLDSVVSSCFGVVNSWERDSLVQSILVELLVSSCLVLLLHQSVTKSRNVKLKYS